MGFNVSNLLYPEGNMQFCNFSKYGASLANGGTLLVGLSGVRYRIHAMVAVAGSATDLAVWRNNNSVIFGPVNLAANGQLVLPYSPVGWFQASTAEAIMIWQTDAATIKGVIIYSEV